MRVIRTQTRLKLSKKERFLANTMYKKLPDTYLYRGGTYQLQDLGNYSFGTLSRAAGYSYPFVQFGAGMYQIYSNTSRWSFLKIPFFGDDPREALFIYKGYNH